MLTIWQSRAAKKNQPGVTGNGDGLSNNFWAEEDGFITPWLLCLLKRRANVGCWPWFLPSLHPFSWQESGNKTFIETFIDFGIKSFAHNCDRGQLRVDSPQGYSFARKWNLGLWLHRPRWISGESLHHLRYTSNPQVQSKQMSAIPLKSIFLRDQKTASEAWYATKCALSWGPRYSQTTPVSTKPRERYLRHSK